MEEKRDDIASSIGLLVLRVGIGAFMLTHGLGKLQMLLAGQFDKFADPIGLGKGISLALMTFAEFFCALSVIFGFATRFAAVPLIFGMTVAAAVVHSNDPWTMGEGARLFMTGASKSWAAKEPALLYLIPFLSLVFTGAGRFSIDEFIRQRRQERSKRSGYQ
ncbi:MAG: DoxX family protein [Deltaproteobacteria bacterium]|nr:DoxX family protein [Deltaproteobacteria bacterium]